MRWLSGRVHLDWLFGSREFIAQEEKRLAHGLICARRELEQE
jgi:hypothetical protein